MQAPSAAPTGWVFASPLSGVVASLEGPTMALIRATVLRPLHLGPSVTANWVVTRDIAMGLVLTILLYGIIRAQIGPAIGLDGPSPWQLVPRLVAVVLGVVLSLSLVRALLTVNNLLCSALQAASPGGPESLVRPLEAGLGAIVVPGVLGVAADTLALLILLGLGVLACSYLIRAAEIVLLALLLPLAMALWLIPAAAGAYRAIVGQLIVAIFIQTVQQVVLLVMATGLGGSPVPGLGWLWACAALALLFRCRGLLSAAVHTAGEWVPAPGRVVSALAPLAIGPGRALGRLWPLVNR